MVLVIADFRRLCCLRQPNRRLRTTTLIVLETSLRRVKPCADGGAQGRHEKVMWEKEKNLLFV
jgi:hypothetical protein